MPRFFMHLRDGTDEVLDPDGIVMPMDAVPGAALFMARDTMSHDVKNGRVELKCRIDVHNEEGEIVHSVPFTHAVEIVPAP
jgi:hypothetical protein